MAGVFAANLSRLRQAKGVSQRKAAAELGVSQALLSHYENGIREPGLDFLCRVCSYYQVSADYILGRNNRKNALTGTPVRTEANSTEFDLEKLTEIDSLLLGDCIVAMEQMLAELGSRQLVNEVFAGLSLELYGMMRKLAAKEADALAGVDSSCVDARIRAAVSIAQLGAECQLEQLEYPQFGDLDIKFPEYYQSIVQVMYSAGTRLKRI